MTKYVIIVAGGIGSRMKSQLPKQFLLLSGQPILQRTITRFYEYDASIEIIVTLPKEHFSTWKNLCIANNFNIPHQIIEGGETRFHSVKNGLSSIVSEGLVGIHDAVRPLVNSTTLANCYNTAQQKGNAVPVISVVETLRELKNNSSCTVNRDRFKLVQTPQCFLVTDIQKAYQQDYSVEFTDDASVVESTGIEINLVDGNRENIKVTTPEDLIIAEAILNAF